MGGRSFWTIIAGIVGGTALAASVALPHEDGKEAGHGHAAQPTPPSIRITDKELHDSPGGVPRGWKFTVPAGDPKAGREAFVKFECFKCHTVRGERFPTVSKGTDDVGPDMTGMGDHHPAEFFAQSILDPNAVILDEKGYTGPDGKSKMPDFTESMTLRELIDLVAYIGSLKGGHGHGPAAMPAGPAPGQHGHGPTPSTGAPMPGQHAQAAPGRGHPPAAPPAHPTAPAHPAAPTAGSPPHGPAAGHGTMPIGEGTAGDYRVALVFTPKGSSHGHEPRAGHVMAFVKDRESGQDVPYLEVSVAFAGPGTPAASLPPMLGGHGFHYGSDMAFMPGQYQVKVSIGPARGLQAGGKYQQPAEVTFPWELK